MKLTPITNPVALRRDTTVGTRIFSGNTMIYGDTGWRDVRSWFTPYFTFEAAHTWAYMKRNGSAVTLEVQAFVGEGQAFTFSNDIAVGFRPPMRYARFLGVADVVGKDSVISVRNNVVRDRLTLGVAQPSGANIGFSVTWETRDDWPTTLPGLPV